MPQGPTERSPRELGELGEPASTAARSRPGGHPSRRALRVRWLASGVVACSLTTALARPGDDGASESPAARAEDRTVDRSERAGPRGRLARLVTSLRRVGREGRGNAEAQRAWSALVRHATPDDVPDLLVAIDGRDVVADNWLRSAIESIVHDARRARRTIPLRPLESIVRRRSLPPRARELALTILDRASPGARDRLIPLMIDDPSPTFRHAAVERLLRRATGKDDAGKIAVYRKALNASVDPDQIDTCAKNLRELGEEVDLARHFGFVLEWKLTGPFDNREKKGFDTAYAPESTDEISLDTEYEGLDGTAVGWIDYRSEHELGKVDLNDAIVRAKGVVAYALHDFSAREAGPVELRVATVNAWKIWVNGELLFSRDEYHHGTRIDHYRVPAVFHRGLNRILVKVCQNEQTEDYADPWAFQLRVSDPVGKAVLSTARDKEGAPE